MRTLLVIIGLAASPAPDLQAQLQSALDEAHQCNPIAMDRRHVEPLIGLIDGLRAPGLEIVYCDGKKERLKNGYQARSWAAMQCGGNPGRKFKLELDGKGRLKKLQFTCD